MLVRLLKQGRWPPKLQALLGRSHRDGVHALPVLTPNAWQPRCCRQRLRLSPARPAHLALGGVCAATCVTTIKASLHSHVAAQLPVAAHRGVKLFEVTRTVVGTALPTLQQVLAVFACSSGLEQQASFVASGTVHLGLRGRLLPVLAYVPVPLAAKLPLTGLQVVLVRTELCLEVL